MPLHLDLLCRKYSPVNWSSVAVFGIIPELLCTKYLLETVTLVSCAESTLLSIGLLLQLGFSRTPFVEIFAVQILFASEFMIFASSVFLLKTVTLDESTLLSILLQLLGYSPKSFAKICHCDKFVQVHNCSKVWCVGEHSLRLNWLEQSETHCIR